MFGKGGLIVKIRPKQVWNKRGIYKEYQGVREGRRERTYLGSGL